MTVLLQTPAGGVSPLAWSLVWARGGPPHRVEFVSRPAVPARGNSSSGTRRPAG